jgi:integral membrane protein (TIGR01906 family)
VTSAARPGWTAALAVLASVSVVIAILGVAVTLFFNPLWIGFEQERSGVPAITGYTPDQVRAVTGSILADLFVGPPEFAVAVDGLPVLDAAERSHMVDVRNVLLPVTILFGAAIAVLAVLLATSRRRVWLWRAIALGSGGLAVVGIVAGIAVVFSFDAAFLLFHRVFFPQGNFSFDPRTQRLTQLFPDQFWTETSIAIAVVGLLVAAVVSVVARRRAGRLRADAL